MKAQFQKKTKITDKLTIYWNGRSYGIKEALAVVEQEQNRGNFQAVVDLCGAFIAKIPNLAELHNKQGLALHALGQFHKALTCYDKAIALKPNLADYYNNRGLAYHALGEYEKALASYDTSIALGPGLAVVHNNRGSTLRELKRYDEALVCYDKAIELGPHLASPYNNRGFILVNKGLMEEARTMFFKALELKPDFSNALENIVNIHKYQSADNPEAKMIQALLDKPDTKSFDKEPLYFSLGKIYDDCGLYDKAFECYQSGNQIRQAAVPYSPEEAVKRTNDLMEVFSKDFLSRSFGFSSQSQLPIFIVGMPRSGTTLLASILSNHPQVATAGELPTIIELISQVAELSGSGIPYPQAVRHITDPVSAYLIKSYEKRLRRDITIEVTYIIDKHPINFMNLGFISMLFPKARVLHCTRHPLDIGLSNYFQRFALCYDYAFDLNNIGHFYGEYARLMEHWRKVIPLKMMDIPYEEMVTQTEQTARKVLDFLGLEWDERCLAPHTNSCAVETASRWQVRQPIYNQSVEKWRHYEKHLEPLKKWLNV